MNDKQKAILEALITGSVDGFDETQVHECEWDDRLLCLSVKCHGHIQGYNLNFEMTITEDFFRFRCTTFLMRGTTEYATAGLRALDALRERIYR